MENMIQMIVNALVSRQSQYHTMSDEDEKIYRYGYFLLCEVVLNLIIALIIGIVSSKFIMIMFFLGMYIPLRSFCGGWHADQIWKCTVISNMILLLQVYGLEKLLSYLSIRVMWFIFFLNMICIYFIAPVDTEKKKIIVNELFLCVLHPNPIEYTATTKSQSANAKCVYYSHKEKEIYRKKIRFILALHLIVMSIVTLRNADELIFGIMFVYIIQNIMLLLEIVRQKRIRFER